MHTNTKLRNDMKEITEEKEANGKVLSLLPYILPLEVHVILE